MSSSSLRVQVVDDYGLKTVQEYMYHIRYNAEMSVRNLLRDVAHRLGSNELSAIDYLDDGSPVSQHLCWKVSQLLIPHLLFPNYIQHWNCTTVISCTQQNTAIKPPITTYLPTYFMFRLAAHKRFSFESISTLTKGPRFWILKALDGKCGAIWTHLSQLCIPPWSIVWGRCSM